jgi:hypothetical protein
VGVRNSDAELNELDKLMFTTPHLREVAWFDGTMIIPANTSLRANISKLAENDTAYAIHLIAQKNELYLRKIFGSWPEAEQAIANLHLSEPFAQNASSKFAMGHVQYGEFVENLKPIEPGLLGFQIGL